MRRRSCLARETLRKDTAESFRPDVCSPIHFTKAIQHVIDIARSLPGDLHQPPTMATQPPTTQSLQNWEDAFIHHSLPTVRALEKDLRKNIEDNRSKLRSLVGTSYRDLLGTAERIIEMDGQMSSLEHGLRDMGRRCDARTLERAGANWAGMRRKREQGRTGLVAQTKLLQGCLTVVGRVVKGKGDALLGAKVLVLARLLVKSIGEDEQAPAVLEELKKRLAVLRKRLLGYIERSMARAVADKGAMAGTLCAYALVTSSAPKEVLRHFLQVMLRRLEEKAEPPGEGELMEMLDLYSGTLLDTRDVFPRSFAEALSQLSKVPLLRDAQVYGSPELSLDIYGQWIAEDVRSFTPWLRHDQVTNSEVSDALTAWTKQAHECLIAGLEEYLEKQEDLGAVVESRHAVILKFMAASSKLRSGAHVKAIDRVRDTFLRRMKALAAGSAALPQLLLEPPAASETPARKDSLWDLAKKDIDMSKGAHAFRRSIVRRRNGRDTFLDDEISKLDAWVKRIEGSLESIEHARSRRWDDDLDFDLDDLEDGDELHEMLSKGDPQELMESLSSAVETSASSHLREIQDSGESASDAAHVLRLFRELDARLRSLQSRLTFTPAHVSLQALHRNLAAKTARQAIDAYLKLVKQTSHVATTLWDGTPPLPVQPAPSAFKFLNTLHRAMSDAGDDLWSPQCVVELRRHVAESLGGEMAKQVPLANAKSDLTNGHTEADGSNEDGEATSDEQPGKEAFIQNLFDQLYLQQVFALGGNDGSKTSGLGSSIAELQQRAEVDQASQERMEKSAKEYWKRTYLLFGLLANRARD